MQSKRQSYLTDKAFKLYLSSSILTALSTMVGNIVNSVIVSHYVDHDAMSAVSLSRPLLQFHYTIYQLLGLGACILVGYALGKDDRRKADGLFSLSIVALGIYALLGLIVGAFCPGLIVDMLCKNQEIYGMSMDYARLILIGTPLFMGIYFLSAFTSLDGSPRLVSKAMIADNVLNLILSLLFVGVFGMGVWGCGLALLSGHVLALVMMGRHWFGKTNLAFSGFRFKDSGFKTSSAITSILKTGYPFAVASICLTIYLWAANTMIQNHLGKDGLYIFSVVLSLLTFYNFFVTGACQTLQSLGALLVGQGDIYGLRQSVNSAFRFIITCLLISCGVLWIAPGIICSLFDCPDNLLAECKYAIRIYAVAFWLFFMLYLLMVDYKLLKNTVLSTFISFALSLMVIPAFFVTTNWFPQAVWWSNLIAYSIVALIVLFISLYYQKKDKNLSFVTLLPKHGENPSLDLSVEYDSDKLQDVHKEIEMFLNNNDIDKKSVFNTCLCTEELLLNVIEGQQLMAHGQRKRSYIDLRVVIDKDIIISIHDDSKPFDPVKYDGETGFGLQIARGLCKDIQYKYMFGQNMTLCTINK